MNGYALAVDIGASSGRHILGHIENGRLVTEEVYRFGNGPDERDGALVWDADRLKNEIVAGLKKCAGLGKIPDTMGIDTWGVDYALLDKQGALIGPLYCYRDKRGAAAAAALHEKIPYAELYSVTGTQYQPFNTIYQLYDDKRRGRLDEAEDMLLLPSYLSYLLTGERRQEYTEASTTGLLDAETRDWANGLIDRVGLPRRLFRKPEMPSALGRFTPEVRAAVGFDCTVMLPATHDTASAVMSVTDDKAIYISSGTWSLMGRVIPRPVLDPRARALNYTNEGAADGRIRFLKNIMGLWLIQCYRRELDNRYTFAELAEMAAGAAVYDWALDVNADCFMAPERVSEAIRAECARAGVPAPKTPAETAHCIFSSLAHEYARAADGLDELLDCKTDTIYIVGGGSKNAYLNALTQTFSGRRVVTGHPEATAAGNLGKQFILTGLLTEESFLTTIKNSL